MNKQRFPFAGFLVVDMDAIADKKLSESITVLDNDCHAIEDVTLEGFKGYNMVFNSRKRTLTVRKEAPKPQAEASTIDEEFAKIANGGSFTLDTGPSPEEKFRAVCTERGYSDDLAKKVRAIIAQHGSSDAVKERLNTLLKARKAKVMRADDWKVAQELTAAK